MHGDERGEDTHQEQDQHHVLSKPAAIVLSCITLYCIVTDSAMSSSPYVLLLHPWRPPPTEEVFVRVKVSAPEASVDMCRYVDIEIGLYRNVDIENTNI